MNASTSGENLFVALLVMAPPSQASGKLRAVQFLGRLEHTAHGPVEATFGGGIVKPPACPPRPQENKAEEADICYAAKTGQLNSLSTLRSRDERAPLDQRGRASLLVDLPRDEMALLVEMIVDLSVN